MPTRLCSETVGPAVARWAGSGACQRPVALAECISRRRAGNRAVLLHGAIRATTPRAYAIARRRRSVIPSTWLRATVNQMSHPPTSQSDGLLPVAQYVRMSTDQQQYSIDNQREGISRYALEHSMEIVRTYSDAAKSGLSLQDRPGLKQLLADVESGSPGYSGVLVYDVSRWGRFQDADESAFYEYRCRRAKIAVHYCAEAFPNDSSLTAALLKAIKRTMAAEYSRELSVSLRGTGTAH
jgi:Resolvase, N terminal domain